MEIGLLVKIEDLLAQTEAILADGKADLHDNVLYYLEKDNPQVSNEIEIEDTSIKIKRNGEQKSIININSTKDDKALITSMLGTLEFDTKCIKLERSDDKWSVEYQLFSDGKLINHTRVIWLLKGIGNEQN